MSPEPRLRAVSASVTVRDDSPRRPIGTFTAENANRSAATWTPSRPSMAE